MVMLRLWLNTSASSTGVNRAASGSELERALRAAGRADIVEKCAVNVEMVTDDLERKMASRAMQAASQNNAAAAQPPAMDGEPIVEEVALKVRSCPQIYGND